MLSSIKSRKAFCRSPNVAGLVFIMLALYGQQAKSEIMIKIDGIGPVPAKVVRACEQATGDGGHETFFDADWDYFSDCINDELYRRRKK